MIPAHGGLELLGPAKATRLLRESQDVTGCDREVVGSTAGQGELVLRTHDCTSSAGRNNQQTLSSPYQTPTNHPPFTGLIFNLFLIFKAIVEYLEKRVLVLERRLCHISDDVGLSSFQNNSIVYIYFMQTIMCR